MKKLILFIIVILTVNGCSANVPAVPAPAPQETLFTDPEIVPQNTARPTKSSPLPTIYSVSPLPNQTIPEFSRVFQKKEDGLFEAPFEADYAASDTAAVGVSAGIYESEKLPGVYSQVLDDIERISQVMGVYGGPVTVYIMDDSALTGCYAVNNAAVCSKAAFEDSSYIFALAQAMYGNHARWFGYGVTGLVNGTKPDEQVLLKNYADSENLNLLGLSPLRFEPAWCSEKELKLAEDTSVALCEYTLKAYDAQTLVFGMTDAIKTEWLRSIGVDRPFNYPYAECLNGFVCVKPESDNFAVSMKSERDRFNLNYVEYLIETAEQAEAFVYDNQAGRAKITELLRREAPDLTDKMDLDVAVTYDIYGGRALRKHGWNESGIISFYHDPLYHLHECIHGMAGTKDRNHWIDEGLPIYLSSIYFPSELTAQAFRSTVLNCIENPISTLNSADPRKIDYTACEYYLNNGGDIEQFDMRLAIDAYAFSTLSNPGIDYSDCFSSPTYSKNNIVSAKRLEADELSYHQAGSFVAYLGTIIRLLRC